ncbi:MAG: thiamine phosphate synthase [Parvularculaceae bacterium]
MDGVRHEGLRERAGKLAAAAEWLKQQSGVRRAAFSLAFLTDSARVPDPFPVAQALPAGAAVILRDYEAPQREQLARGLRSICAARSLLLLIGADAQLARAVDADGLHLRAADLKHPPEGASDFPLRSASCHDAEQLDAAEAVDADIAFLSPAFATESHPESAFLGRQKFSALAVGAAMPVLALGGVDEWTCRYLAGPNVAGIGAIGAFMPRARSSASRSGPN